MKVRATSLSKTRGRQANTPIKEEDVEEEFDEGRETPENKAKGQQSSEQAFLIESAHNFDSAVSDKTLQTGNASSSQIASSSSHGLGLQNTLLHAKEDLRKSNDKSK
jgi:hypothetical protein